MDTCQPPEDGLPPAEVRIRSLSAEPWPEDARRVRVMLDLTPFQQRPDLEIVIANGGGEPVASTSIVENIEAHIVITMHIRGPQSNGPFTLTAALSYPDLGVVDQKKITFLS